MSFTGHVTQLAEQYRHREFPGDFIRNTTIFAGGEDEGYFIIRRLRVRIPP